MRTTVVFGICWYGFAYVLFHSFIVVGSDAWQCFSLQARVEQAGGQILYWNGHRVMGILAMSRAIGDHALRPYVISDPEVRR